MDSGERGVYWSRKKGGGVIDQGRQGNVLTQKGTGVVDAKSSQRQTHTTTNIYRLVRNRSFAEADLDQTIRSPLKTTARGRQSKLTQIKLPSSRLGLLLSYFSRHLGTSSTLYHFRVGDSPSINHHPSTAFRSQSNTIQASLSSERDPTGQIKNFLRNFMTTD
ncbi:hypothetical protein NPIL_578261 [Nephila pilipes]|uniref:Uncharacterized protein n=1 Tax=Nephila pilipes TaxID=299642 RepID=A0A8X6P9W2_NEPPI|nr:hypothetical protein NPIL_578261 [Nephila pilipes]